VNEGTPDLLLRALGQRIRELRNQQGYSQEGFADRCGVHRTFMGTVERGESNLSFHNIAKVSATLGVSLSELFGGLEAKANELVPQPDRGKARRNSQQSARRDSAGG
jgi:transcriptional regulator with XRE-family HTH domain